MTADDVRGSWCKRSANKARSSKASGPTGPQHVRERRLRLESLESRTLLTVNPVINEFMADNNNFFFDNAGDDDDWIEIYNYGD